MTTKPAGGFTLRVEHVDGYEFRVVFDKDTHPPLSVDEPAPLGKDQGPNPARLLAAAVASCLSASLVFCLSRAKIPVDGLKAEVRTELVRNERNRLRIGKLNVQLQPDLPEGSADPSHCLEVFEDFCVVTESVRQGIDVDVAVTVDGVSTYSTRTGGSSQPSRKAAS